MILFHSSGENDHVFSEIGETDPGLTSGLDVTSVLY